MVQEASRPTPLPLPAPGGRPPELGEVPPRQVPFAEAPHHGVPHRSGAPLDRLLDVAVLTPAQAAHIAVQLLTAASQIGQGRRSDVRVSLPQITPTGEVQVVKVTDPAAGDPVDDVLVELVENARRLPAHPRLPQVALLRRLEEVTGSPHEPAARALMLRETLDDSLGPGSDARLQRELADLVTAFAELSDGKLEEPMPMRPRPAPRVTTPPPRRRLGRRRRSRRGRWIAVAVPLCLVVLAGGYVAYERLASGGSDPAPRHHHPHSAVPTRSMAPHARTHHQGAVPVLAQRSAGQVTGVQLQRLGACQPGGQCPVQVTVNLTPSTLAQTVGWRVAVVQACTRNLTWSLPTSITAQAGWSHVYASSSVQIPTDHPYALVAVTSAPDRAQSPPDLLSTAAPRC